MIAGDVRDPVRESYRIAGREVRLPVEVRDASTASVIYPVQAADVQRWLPDDALRVVADPSGMAQLVLALIDYRDNDLGDYNEISIVLFVTPRGSGPETAAAYIHRLPVNQAFTCEAGRTIWGYPKTVERIEFSRSEGALRGRLEMDGQHVFTLTVPCGDPAPGAESTTLEVATYSYLDGVPHRTAATNRGLSVVSPGPAGVSLELGSHPVADELRALGLPRDPLLSTWTASWSGSFGAPEKV